MEVQWSYTQQHVDKTTNKKVLVGILRHIKTVCKIMSDYVRLCKCHGYITFRAANFNCP